MTTALNVCSICGMPLDAHTFFGLVVPADDWHEIIGADEAPYQQET